MEEERKEIPEYIRKAKKKYTISIIIFIILLLFTFTFEKTMENQAFIYRILELLGLYKTIGEFPYMIVIAVIIIILAAMYYYFYGNSRFYRINKPNLRLLPFLLILITVIGHVSFKPVYKLLLSYQKDLGAVIDIGRGDNGIHSVIRYTDNTDLNTIYFEKTYNLDLLNCGNECLTFYVKFVEINEPHREFIYKNKNGEPHLFTLDPRSYYYDYNFDIDINAINPNYKNEEPEGELPKYYIVIYNKNDSKTFHTYFN